MQDQFSRTRLLMGRDALERLRGARVIVFGVGGVGGYAVEVLARSGVGEITVVDNDTVSLTNINRQIIALHSTIGQDKTEVVRRRVADINPQCKVTCVKQFYLPETADEIDLAAYDYVVDCIDTVKAKMELARRCHTLGVPLICSMGAANKMDCTRLRVDTFLNTRIDPIARIMRKKLRKEGVTNFKCAYSDELPLEPRIGEVDPDEVELRNGNTVPASNAWLPAAMGLLIGSEVVKDLVNSDV